MELQPEIKMQQWTHPRCGNTITVPYEGIKNTNCPECGHIISVPKFSENPTALKRKSKTNSQIGKWGTLQPMVSKRFEEHKTVVHRVNPQKTLQSHFDGFEKLRMVMYVQRVDFIQDLFDKHGIQHAQVIVGDSIVKKNRSSSEPEVFLRLAELISEGKLEIRIPTKKRTFHEKWILAEKEGEFSDIFGTANLTEQGSGKTGKQSNQERVTRVTGSYKDSPLFNELGKEFEWYLDNSEPYLDDLVDLLKLEVTEESPAIEVVEKWISYTGASTTGDTRKVQAIVQEFTETALKDSLDPDQLVTTIQTSASDTVLDAVVKVLGPSGVQRQGREIIATIRPFLQHRVTTFPVMSVIDDRFVLQVGSDSAYRTAENYDIDAIKNGLHGIHQYVETIDKASVKNKLIAKKTMYEIILYFLTAPMHHYFMETGKKELGWHYNRGPKPLAIYGNTKNGKTFLLRFCSKLLTGGGNVIEPFKDDDFSPTKIRNLLSWSSLFPVIVDDISDSKWGKQCMDQIGRNYWDNWWSNERNHSQLIVTSNRRVPQGQLKGRMKEIVMDARFEDKTENIRHVSDILNQDNTIFEYFSKRYLEILNTEPRFYNHKDCMHVGRRVMEELYEMASLKVPSYFPKKPLEDIVDGNALVWLALFNEGDALWSKTPQGELKITFTNAEEGYEIKRYMDLIPEGFDPKRSGKMIRIPVPKEFIFWLKESRSSFEPKWLKRNLKKLLKLRI